MSRVSLLGRLFPSSKSSAKLYLAVGTQAVYAGVYRQGAWQKQFAVKIGMVAGPTAGQGAAVDLLSDSLQSLKNRLLAFFAQQAKPIGRVELYVSVSGRWLSSETLPWSDAVRTVGLHAMATEHLEQSGCVLGAGDVVRWEDAPWGSPRWVVAYPFSVLQALQRLAAAVGGNLVSVLPAAHLVAQLSHRQGGGLGIVGHLEPGLFHLIEVEKGCVQSTVQRAVEVDANSGDGLQLTQKVRRIWHGLQLRTPHFQDIAELAAFSEDEAHGASATPPLKMLPWPDHKRRKLTPMLRALHWVHTVRSAVDAVAVRTSLSFKHYFLLASACVVTLTLVWMVVLNVQVIRGMESARQAAKPLPVQSAPTSLTKVQQDQVVAVNAAIRQVNMPVGQLLRALQPPADIRVALLGIDLNDDAAEAGLPKLKLTAEALSGEEMTRYVGFIEGRRPFVRSTLIRHEVMQNLPENPWRFTMEVTWRP